MVPVASPGALVALKTFSMVRRPHSNSPHKVGSDIHDLVRLVTAVGARTIATDIAQDFHLATWVADQVDRAFDHDSRYTLLRLRRNDRSTSAQSLTTPRSKQPSSSSTSSAIVCCALELGRRRGHPGGPLEVFPASGR